VKTGRKEKERELRVGLVLEAAERVFGKKPYEEASMLEIAKEAQLGMQSLYNIFPSKKVLYESLVNQRAKEFQSDMDEATSKNTSPIEALRQWAFVHFKTMAEYSAFYPVLLKEKFNYEWGIESRFLPDLKATFMKEEHRLAAILESAQEAGYLKKMPVHYIRGIFLSFLQLKLEYHFRSKKSIEVNKCVEETLDLFLNGLKG
jgi:AcrR family transcriptional regulator